MFRSIFNRLMITYALLIILITGSLAVFMSIGFNRYVFNEKKTLLAAAAIKVEGLLNSYNSGSLTKAELQVGIDTLGFLSDATIYVVKVNQSTLNNPASVSLAQQLSEAYMVDDLKKILAGKTVYRKKQFSEALNTDVVFYGTPLKQDHKTIGAVLIFSPLDPINSWLAKINAMIAGTALFALIISFFFISFSSARISRPIKQMEEITRKIANGEESPELNIHTGDEIEQLANSFNHMKQQVASTELMRREFIANVSHELRTPLTSINGFTQGMLDGLIQPHQYPHYLTVIQSETQRLMRLTGDILELAKLQGGRLTLHKQHLSVTDQLNKALEAFEMQRAQKQIRFRIDCAADLYVWADPDRLQQILHNIIDNAMRYSSEGQQINIRVQKQTGFLQFAITDYGTGISTEDLPYVFERFYRDEKSRFGITGSGLGLSIVKNLVEAHGGKITVKSQAGQETSFIFNLPEA